MKAVVADHIQLVAGYTSDPRRVQLKHYLEMILLLHAHRRGERERRERERERERDARMSFRWLISNAFMSDNSHL